MASWLTEAVTIDFETLPIEVRPHYPPFPVGVAVLEPRARGRYLAWHHPSGNTCTWEDARSELGRHWESRRPLLFQNAGFDLEVATAHFELPWPDWRRVHDTLPMLFLDDPHAPSYGLKESAERILGEPPGARDAVVDWLVEHQPMCGVKISDKLSSKHYAVKYTALAPVRLAGRYAVGDVRRTKRLARKLYPDLVRRGMCGAYELEIELLMYMIEMERHGVRVDLGRLQRDIELYEAVQRRLDAWLRKKLRATADANLNSDTQLGNALVAAGLADPVLLGTNSKGYQVNRDALDRGVTDRQTLAALRYRAKLGTSLGTFMRPWEAIARQTGGIIHTRWHSTRREKGDGTVGTRTGRLSSTPNFQNMIKKSEPVFRSHDRSDKSLPPDPFRGLLTLPLIRGYVVPYNDDEVLIDRDYSQQEFRILGHYEGEAICEAYLTDPWVDFHELVRQMMSERLGLTLERKPVKGLNFGLLYGMGVGKLADRTGTTVEQAKAFKKKYLETFPGMKGLYAEMRRRAAADEPIHTWGGREYYCEPPKIINGQLRKFDYKLPNVLIQGGAADCTKRATLLYLKAKPRHHRLYLSTHDQLTSSVPRGERDEGMALLQACMEAMVFDVPMLSEGSWSDQNFAALAPYDKKGVRCAR